MTKNKLTPEQRLMKAIFGSTEPTEEQLMAVQERFDRYKAESVSEKKFRETWGISIEEHVDQMMLYAGWCDTIMDWKMKHQNDRKYKVSEEKPIFTLGEVCDLVQMIYCWGHHDEKDDIDEYTRLWTINRQKYEEE